MFSPVTGLRVVEVEGGEPEVYRIKAALAPFRQTPWVRQNRARMADAILRDPRLERASIKTNVFGRAYVQIEPRNPVAAIPTRGVLLSSTGVLYPAEEIEGLPAIQLPPGSHDVQLTLTGAWPLKSMAQVAVKGREFLGELPFSLVLDERSVISLQVSDGLQIVLGTDSQLDHKFAVLERARGDNPEQFRRTKVINVSAPDRPVFSSP